MNENDLLNIVALGSCTSVLFISKSK